MNFGSTVATFRRKFLRRFEIPAPIKALAWLCAQESSAGGLLRYSGALHGDAAVTGALLPLLVRCGERELANRSADWLLSIQMPGGSYPASDDQNEIFVTTQVLRGLLATPELQPRTMRIIEKATEYLLPRQLETRDSIDSSRKRIDAHSSTDALAEEAEALIFRGETPLAGILLNEVENRQREDGSVLETSRGSLVSSVTLARLAMCWHQTGRWEPADRALDWLERRQRRSGGFCEKYRRQNRFRSPLESTWTVKYYLEAHWLRVRAFMERCNLSHEVRLDDGRVQALTQVIRPGDRIVEVGCGKGRFLRAIHHIYPEVHCSGVDIVPGLMAGIPQEISTSEGSLECIPHADGSFDVSFSVEAVEHSINIEAAIRELSRITRSGGWIVIIDKQNSKWGTLECPGWEHWPVADHLVKLLEKYCNTVTCEWVGYEGRRDGLMLVWKGRKPAAAAAPNS